MTSGGFTPVEQRMLDEHNQEPQPVCVCGRPARFWNPRQETWTCVTCTPDQAAE